MQKSHNLKQTAKMLFSATACLSIASFGAVSVDAVFTGNEETTSSYIEGAFDSVDSVEFPNVNAEPGDGQITLSWDAIEGATSYSVYSEDGTIKYNTDDITETSYTVTGLANGHKYQFRIHAYVGGDEVISTPITRTLPAKWGEITAEPGDGQIALSWPAVEDATSYSVYSEDGTIKYNTDDITETSYTVTGLANGHQYQFRIHVYIDGEEFISPTVTKTLPAKWGEITAEPGDGQIVLSWPAVDDATSYSVYSEDGTIKYNTDDITETSYTVTGLTNGHQYQFRIHVYIDGEEFISPTVTKTLPAKWGEITAEPGDGQITLSWPAVEDATSYSVYSEDGTIKYNTDDITETSYTVTGLANGHQYQFRIHVYIDGEEFISPTVTKTLPAKWGEITAEPGDGQITLSWPAVEDATSYSVYSEDGTIKYNTDDITETSYTVTGLANGHQYQFRIHVYIDGEEFISPTVTKTLPVKWGEITAEPGDGQIALSWPAVEDATSYSVYSEDGTIKYNTDDITETSYIVTGLANGHQYQFRIHVYIDNEEFISPAVTKTLPVKWGEITAESGDGQIKLSWPAVDDATGYLVKSADGKTQYTAKTIKTNSYTVTGLNNGYKYQFKVYAYVDGKWFNSSTVTKTIPVKFTNVTATAGDKSITLTWDKVDNATGYLVKSADGKTQYTAKTIKTNSYTVTGLNNGYKYQFKVYAYVDGKWFNSSTVTKTIPVKFTNVTATAGDKSITLTWDKVDNATSYIIKSADGKTQYTAKTIKTNSYTVTGLNNGYKYQFKVYAYVDGRWFNSSTVTKTIPVKFTNVTATAGDKSITLTWDKVDNATSYIIKSADGKTQYTAKTIKTNSYTVTGLNNGYKYQFKVYAYVDGRWFNSSTVTKTIPAKITNVTATAGDKSITLTWDKVDNATGYLVKSADGKTQYTAKTIKTNSYTVTGLNNGYKYQFKVYAYVGGSWFNSSTVTKTIPAKITNVTATAGSKKVTLTWDKVDNATGYLVKSADGKTQYTTKAITNNSYTVTGLTGGTKYKFRIYVCVDGNWFSSSTITKTALS